jgi:hypothetical protein
MRYINLNGLVIPVKIVYKYSLSVTVEVLEDVKAYRKGDRLNVNYRDIQTFDPNKVEIKDNE